MKHAHPCVSLCQFDGRTGWCSGCGCSLAEIRQWRKMSPYHRTALERLLPGRLRQIGPEQAAATGDGRAAGRRARLKA